MKNLKQRLVASESFEATSHTELNDLIDDWLMETSQREPDFKFLSCNYSMTKLGAWDAPDGESILYSALIIYGIEYQE